MDAKQSWTTGEFYFEETVLNNYGFSLKTEAAFYSENLVRYLVDQLNIPLSRIIWKVITKRALKSDTFSSVRRNACATHA